MSRSLLLKLLPAVLLVLMAGTALAGGVVVSLDDPVTDVSAGTPFDVNFTIRSAHDGSLQDDWHPIVLATHPATGETLTFQAVARDDLGGYTATLNLPVEGQWAWRIAPEMSYPEQLIADMTPISVLSAADLAPAPAAVSVAPPVAAWVGAAAVSLAAVGWLVVIGLRRRAPAAV